MEDISTINKLDTQTDFYTRLQLDLYTVVENVVQDLSLRASQAGATITHNIPKHLIISGNYTLLYSIFHNIVDNAINYVEKAQINIQLTNQDPSNLYFSITDNGQGVPNEALAHIFERFYRVDKGRSRKAGGTGLGLSIVKHAVIFHGGKITAINRPEGGLEFQLLAGLGRPRLPHLLIFDEQRILFSLPKIGANKNNLVRHGILEGFGTSRKDGIYATDLVADFPT